MNASAVESGDKNSALDQKRSGLGQKFSGLGLAISSRLVDVAHIILSTAMFGFFCKFAM